MNDDSIKNNLKRVKAASYGLQDLNGDQVRAVLRDFAAALRQTMTPVLEANGGDLGRMDQNDPLYDRLMLNEARLEAIAGDVLKVADLDSPVGEVMEQRTLPNDLDLSRVRVPLGVVAVIYEARANVTMDVFSLCFRTQNACVLRGGTAAHETNTATMKIIHDVLADHKIDPAVAWLMPPERAHMPALLKAHGLVDVCIPRGSQALIDFVREQAAIPVIETGRGVVHIYIDESADTQKAQDIILNAKTRRPSVCNSLDTLLVHREKVAGLRDMIGGLAEHNVHIYADETCREALKVFYPANLIGAATDDSFDTEFLGLQMNLAAVGGCEKAIDHVRTYGSGHTESVVAEDATVLESFLNKVDASVVMANASTAFSDGGEFGLGAEIGISTQKLHARGPMGLEPLTSYKWLVRGAGQTRAA